MRVMGYSCGADSRKRGHENRMRELAAAVWAMQSRVYEKRKREPPRRACQW
jgi:hypothetical protein